LHDAAVTEDKARGDIQQFAAQLAMHVAASDPQYLSRETMPAAVVDAQRAAYESQVCQGSASFGFGPQALTCCVGGHVWQACGHCRQDGRRVDEEMVR
jgi:translation elongation factor EF-Ts